MIVFLNGKGGIDSVLNFPSPNPLHDNSNNNSISRLYYGGGRVGEEINHGTFNCQYINNVFIKPASPDLQPQPKILVTDTVNETNNREKSPLKLKESNSSKTNWLTKLFK